jgi:ribosome-associated toxin RatA of RatAB toxin-antitoxin module
MSCCIKTIYEYCNTVPECIETLQLITKYADTNVTVRITDRHGNEYDYEVTTDSNGLLTIDLSENPFLTLFNSWYLIALYSDTTCENNLPYTIDGHDYSHIQFVVRNRVQTQTNYLIKINCEENPNYY